MPLDNSWYILSRNKKYDSFPPLAYTRQARKQAQHRKITFAKSFNNWWIRYDNWGKSNQILACFLIKAQPEYFFVIEVCHCVLPRLDGRRDIQFFCTIHEVPNDPIHHGGDRILRKSWTTTITELAAFPLRMFAFVRCSMKKHLKSTNDPGLKEKHPR